jgi:hypothetical protein
MSADNGVYILTTRSSDPNREYEYRVAYATAIENCYDPDPHYRSCTIKQIFGNKKVVYNLPTAKKLASRLHEKLKNESGWDIEYGVIQLGVYKEHYFDDLILQNPHFVI